MSYYVSTLRHLTTAQIWHRSVRIIRRRCWRTLGKTAPHSVPAKLAPTTPLFAGLDSLRAVSSISGEVAAAIDRAHACADNNFSFLNQPVAFGESIRWHDPQLSHLWR